MFHDSWSTSKHNIFFAAANDFLPFQCTNRMFCELNEMKRGEEENVWHAIKLQITRMTKPTRRNLSLMRCVVGHAVPCQFICYWMPLPVSSAHIRLRREENPIATSNAIGFCFGFCFMTTMTHSQSDVVRLPGESVIAQREHSCASERRFPSQMVHVVTDSAAFIYRFALCVRAARNVHHSISDLSFSFPIKCARNILIYQQRLTKSAIYAARSLVCCDCSQFVLAVMFIAIIIFHFMAAFFLTVALTLAAIHANLRNISFYINSNTMAEDSCGPVQSQYTALSDNNNNK